MNRIINLEEWKSDIKTVYYPEFGYLLPNYWSAFHDNYWLEEQVRYHIHQIKTLLLYFDFVLIPIGHLNTSLDPLSRELHDRILFHRDFIEMVEKGFVIASVWGGISIEDYIEAQSDFLRVIKWEIRENRNKFDHLLDKVWYFERNVSGQSNYLFEKIRGLIDINQAYLGSDLKSITRVMKRCEGKHKVPFIHERFVCELRRISTKRTNILLTKSITPYLYSGEYGNPGSIIYNLGEQQGDSLLRKSLPTESYSFLYSPSFFRLFLSLFIDDRPLTYSFRLSPSDIENMRTYHFWSGFVRAYHNLLNNLSTKVDLQLKDGIVANAQLELEQELLKFSSDDNGVEAVIIAVLSVLLFCFKFQLPNAANIPGALRWMIRREFSKLVLRHKDNNLYGGIVYLDRVLTGYSKVY